jgi:signal transduction histidine kinase
LATPLRLARARSGPLRDALAVIAVAGVSAAVLLIALVVDQGGPDVWMEVETPIVALVYFAAGLGAWWRRPSSRLGLLIVLAGGALLLGGLYNLESPPAVAVAAVTQTLVLGVVMHLLLAFPTGRLRRRAERLVIAGGYAVCLVLQAPLYLFTPGEVLAVAERPDLADAGLWVQRTAGALTVLATAALLAGRIRRADPQQRRVLVPLSAYGVLALLFGPVAGPLWPGGADTTFASAQLVVLGLVPIVFVVAASRGGFARTGDIAELGVWLGADEARRPGLRDALATTLGDPTLQLLFHLPAGGGLVDERGVAVGAVAPEPARGAVAIELGGRPVGAIVYDAMLLDRPDEVREAGRIVALAVDRRRLTVELRASRARIAAAADDERRRIARDLHDGLQSRLVFLAVQAATDGDRAALSTGLQSAIDELRELVDGVMPARLTERGLAAAVEGLRERVPTPLRLRVAGLDERLRPDVETAAYFVVSEALANAVKHAAATTLDISLQRDGDRLAIVVADDGAGGAHPGNGMRIMADRVHALDGELTVESPAGGGTQVRAVIPCGP